MDIFIYRSLLFAVVEFLLAVIVLYKGTFHKKTIAVLLLFLGGYQLGEFIFLNQHGQFGLQFAIVSTTLLPPIGILMIEQVRGKIRLYPFFQLAAIFFSALFILDPGILNGSQHTFCLVKFTTVTGPDSIFMTYFGIYYFIGLLTAMVMSAHHYIVDKRKEYRRFYMLAFIAYSTFFPASLALIKVLGDDFNSLASTMCSLAIIAAFILAWASLNLQIKTTPLWLKFWPFQR